MNEESEAMQYAMRYKKMGCSVVPVNSQEKKGAKVKWQPYQTEAPSMNQVSDWWRKWPDAGIAIITGKVSELVVLDLDRGDGKDGIQTVHSLYGEDFGGPRVLTGGGGVHYYFRHPGDETIKNRIALLPGVDLRADGGFVYAPPSVHPSGDQYIWEDPPWAIDFPEMPEWLWDLIAEQERADTETGVTPQDEWERILTEGVAEGKRNDTASRLAGYGLHLGMSPRMVEMLLLQWNENNDPPLPKDEVKKVVKSITKKELMKSGGLGGGEPGEGEFSAPQGDEDGCTTEDPEDRELMLKAVSERFKIPINDIIRIGGSQPIYRFICGDRSVDIRASHIASQWKWRSRIVSATEKVPKKVSNKGEGRDWDELCQLMLDAARHLEPGEEATETGQLKLWVRSYLQRYEPKEDENIYAGNPRMHEGAPYIHTATFKKYVTSEFDSSIDGKTLVQYMKSLGFSRKNLWVPLTGDDRDAVTRSMWRVPEDFRPQSLRDEEAED